jgi:hypothetical protein
MGLDVLGECEKKRRRRKGDFALLNTSCGFNFSSIASCN